MSISPYRKTIADFPFISVLLRRTNIPHRINAPAGCICSGSPFSPVYMPIIPLSDLQERAHFRGIRRTNRSSVRNRRVPRQNRRQPLFTAPSDSTDCMSTRRNRLRGFPTHSQHATKERTGEKTTLWRERVAWSRDRSCLRSTLRRESNSSRRRSLGTSRGLRLIE